MLPSSQGIRPCRDHADRVSSTLWLADKWHPCWEMYLRMLVSLLALYPPRWTLCRMACSPPWRLNVQWWLRCWRCCWRLCWGFVHDSARSPSFSLRARLVLGRAGWLECFDSESGRVFRDDVRRIGREWSCTSGRSRPRDASHKMLRLGVEGHRCAFVLGRCLGAAGAQFQRAVVCSFDAFLAVVWRFCSVCEWRAS